MSLINLNSAGYTSGLQSIFSNMPNIPTCVIVASLTAPAGDFPAGNNENLVIPFPLNAAGTTICTIKPYMYQFSFGSDIDGDFNVAVKPTNTTINDININFSNSVNIPAGRSILLYITCFGGSFSQTSGVTNLTLP